MTSKNISQGNEGVSCQRLGFAHLCWFIYLTMKIKLFLYIYVQTALAKAVFFTPFIVVAVSTIFQLFVFFNEFKKVLSHIV